MLERELLKPAFAASAQPPGSSGSHAGVPAANTAQSAHAAKTRKTARLPGYFYAIRLVHEFLIYVLVLGQSHFIKTVEDLYEAMVNSAPNVRFGLAFNEASGPCLTRSDGNDVELRKAAIDIVTDVAAGHFFAVVMLDIFPIHALSAIRAAPEVCNIFCATANPVEVIVAETEQGRGVLGVIDGSPPKGIETSEHITQRRDFLRKIGYKR